MIISNSCKMRHYLEIFILFCFFLHYFPQILCTLYRRQLTNGITLALSLLDLICLSCKQTAVAVDICRNIIVTFTRYISKQVIVHYQKSQNDMKILLLLFPPTKQSFKLACFRYQDLGSKQKMFHIFVNFQSSNNAIVYRYPDHLIPLSLSLSIQHHFGEMIK